MFFKKAFLLFLFFMMGVLALNAQTATTFSAQPESFFKELDKFINGSKNPKNKEIYDRLVETNKAGKLNAEVLQEIIAMSNVMMERKMTAIPYFTDYYSLINSFYNESTLDKQLFSTWHSHLKNILVNAKKGDNKDFKEMIEFYDNLLIHNILFKNTSKQWYADSQNFTINTSLEAPSVSFEKTNIYAKSSGDSLQINKTQGVYYPLTHIWKGSKGRSDWSRVGLDSSSVHVTFGSYTIQMEQSEYTIDTATLTNTNYIKQKVKGKFEDRLSALNKDVKPYPSFESFENELKFEQFADNVKIKGGLALNGAKVAIKGTAQNPAEILFYTVPKKILAVRTLAEKYVIKKGDEIYSNEAQVYCYLDEKTDSIYHPGLNLNFKLAKNTLTMERLGEGIQKTAFFNTFQSVDMLVDRVSWNLNTDKINFSMNQGGETNSAYFESENYFQASRYDKYQNIADYNIISKLKQYSEANKTKFIDANLFAKYINPKYNLETIERTLYFLVADGYILYDNGNKLITLKPKVFNYVLASAKMIDYDVIRIKSNADSSNAKLNLENFDLDMKGVYAINVSDSQNVVFFPKKKDVKMKLNRDMYFGGTIIAGRVDLYGKDHQFKYEPFTVALPILDSMLCYIPDDSQKDRVKKEVRPLNTTIEKLRGNLAIDGGNNKSGKEDLPEYPFIESLKDSYTYYDKKSIYNGVYNQDKFFFQLDPFRKNNLDKLEKEDLKFEGKMVSANIFPEFDQTLYVMPDYSLGFETDAPSKGNSMYGGVGKLTTGKIILSNKGFEGKNGQIDFQTSKLACSTLKFFPDSTSAQTDTLNMKRRDSGIQYPNCLAHDMKMHWKPYADSLSLYHPTDKFSFKDWDAKLTGNTVITSKGFFGHGLMDWAEATLYSKKHQFNAMTMKADTSDLVLKSLDSNKVVFKIPNVKSLVDFQKQIGDFKSNDKDIPTELPYNKYTTTMNQFKWEMKNKIIRFITPEDPNTLITFNATAKAAKGLSFQAKGGTYNLNNYLLTCTGVKYINVADSKIYPDSAICYIEPEGIMRTLKNCVIRTDTTNEWHVLNQCNITVQSKESLLGNGHTIYQNNAGEKHDILFREIGIKESDDKLRHTTYAFGDITEDQKFKLDRKLFFKGKARLSSDKEFLFFDGFAKFDINSENLTTQWFNFNDDINPENIVVTLNNPVNEKGDTLSVGLNYGVDNANLYTVFIDRLRNRRDFRVFQSTGALRINEATKDYEVGDEDKINGTSDIGSILRINTTSGKLSGEGRLNFGEKFQMVKVQNFGKFTGDFNKSQYNFNSMILIDYFFDEKLGEQLANIIKTNNEDAEDVDYSEPDFDRYIHEYFNEKDWKKLRPTLYVNSVFNKPKELKSQWLFSNVNMVFDTTTNSFHSKGPLGLCYVGAKPIDKIIKKGWIEFGFKKGSEFFNIYLESELEDWIHIYYSKGYLYVLTSDKDFSMALNAIKPDNRRDKGPNNQVFQYLVGSSSKKNAFVDKMQYAEDVASGKIKSGSFDDTNEPEDEVPPGERLLGPDGLPINPDGTPANPDGTPVEEAPKQDPPK